MNYFINFIMGILNCKNVMCVALLKELLKFRVVHELHERLVQETTVRGWDTTCITVNKARLTSLYSV